MSGRQAPQNIEGDQKMRMVYPDMSRARMREMRQIFTHVYGEEAIIYNERLVDGRRSVEVRREGAPLLLADELAMIDKLEEAGFIVNLRLVRAATTRMSAKWRYIIRNRDM